MCMKCMKRQSRSIVNLEEISPSYVEVVVPHVNSDRGRWSNCNDCNKDMIETTM